MSFYFRADRINIGKATMEALGMPGFVHLLVDRKEKWFFIKGCEKDRDAFDVYFKAGEGKDSVHYYINEKPLLKWLANEMGIDGSSQSVRFSGKYLEEEEAAYFDLKDYTVIPYSPD